jgi:plastocyanin
MRLDRDVGIDETVRRRVRALAEEPVGVHALVNANRDHGIAARPAVRRVGLGLALAELAVLLAACGPASPTPAGSGSPAEASETPSGSGATITFSLKEFSITPATATIKAGTSATFAARNDGRVNHALVINGNGVRLTTKDLQFGPGTTETITATLAAGTYKFICPVGAHAGLGMTGTITVTP